MEPLDALLRFLGLVYRAQRLAVGDDAISDAARVKHLRLMLLASDASEHTARRIAFLAESSGAPLARLSIDKATLGGAIGLASCAAAAVTDFGFAGAIGERLRAIDPTLYGEIADETAQRAKRASERKQKKPKRGAKARKA